MNVKFKSLVAAGALALSAAVAPVASQADELRIAIGMAGDNSLVNGMKYFAKRLEERTEGRLTGKVYELSLLDFKEALNGVRDGIADVAYVVPPYHRGEFKYGNLLVDMATIGVNPIVIAAMTNDYLFNCAKCLAEYNAQNQVFLGNSVNSPYYVMSAKKIQNMDDFKGKKIRGFGPYGRWVEHMGATPVVIAANDIYEAISQGQIDGNTHNLDVLTSLSIGEVTDYVLDAPIGVYLGNSMFDTNRDLWNDLSDQDKREMLMAAGEAAAWTAVTAYKEHKYFYSHPAESGVEIVQPSEEVRKASEEFRANDLKTVVELNRDKFGIADAQEQFEIIMGLVKKWEGLLKDVDTADTDAVIDIYMREIYSKVDPNSLG